MFVTMPEKPVKPEPKRDEVELETQIIMRMPVVSKQAHFNNYNIHNICMFHRNRQDYCVRPSKVERTT